MTETPLVLEGEECTRGPEGCGGNVFMRTSRSGLTVAPICEQHCVELETRLDEVAQRYPEVNHPDGCLCRGCIDAW